MSIFNNYSLYYDLLYKDKDYQGETNYIHQLIQLYAPHSKSILELGCGTGKHALLLNKLGYDLYGIDLSQQMIEKANKRLKDLRSDQAYQVSFCCKDLRNFRIDRRFDVVLSLFHVISYQTSNTDIGLAFKTAQTHLKPNGIFIFDCWYGPAVLTERPEVKVKRLENDDVWMVRTAKPVLQANENRVDVQYQIIITDKKTGEAEEIKEIHPMRYLFKPEIELFFSQTGFTLTTSEEWLTGKPLGCDTFGACFVGTRQ